MPKFTLSDRSVAWLLLLTLVGVYHVNGSFLPIADAWPNLALAESLLADGDLVFRPAEVPEFLHWSLRGERGAQPIKITSVDAEVSRLVAEGKLSIDGPEYLLVPTVHEGYYGNTFGLGAGLTALPAVALLHVAWGWQAPEPVVLWHVGKLVASFCVAGSAVFIYLTARQFVRRDLSLLVSFAYALGTCVWATSSQALWQHGPNELFLAAGSYFLCRARERLTFVAACAAAYAAATWCRPTSAVIVVVVGFYFLWTDRRALAVFIAAGIPFGLALAAYHAYLYGSPFAFGQMQLHELAIRKTGSPEIWQTPLWKGAIGQLVSPSRGLFVFSPFLAFSLWGGWVAFQMPVFRVLRPIALAILGMWCVEFSHFDWWNGWAYGNRHIVDTSTLLSLFLVPVIAPIVRQRALAAAFGVLLSWSVFVQIVGAFSYEMSGWNNRLAMVVDLPGSAQPVVTFRRSEADRALSRPGARLRYERLDIDQPQNRHRLWSLGDNQIAYNVTHFFEERRERQRAVFSVARGSGQRSIETWEAIGNGWLAPGDFAAAVASCGTVLETDRRGYSEIWKSLGKKWLRQGVFAAAAAESYAKVLRVDPRSLNAWIGQGLAFVRLGKLDAAEKSYRQALEMDPWSAELHNQFGFMWITAGRFDDAIVEFDRAVSLELGRNSLSYWRTRAQWVDMVLGEREDRAGDLTKADAVVAGLYRGRQLLNQRNFAAAALEFDKIVHLDARLALGHVYLGMVHQRQRRAQEAVDEFLTGAKLGYCSADVEDSWGVALMQLGQAEAAIEHFANAVRLDPNHREAARHLRSAQRVLGGTKTGRGPAG